MERWDEKANEEGEDARKNDVLASMNPYRALKPYRGSHIK